MLRLEPSGMWCRIVWYVVTNILEEPATSVFYNLKVKLSLSIASNAMRTCRIVKVYLHHSWPRHWMKVNGRLHARAALPRKKSTSTQSIGGWVDPRAGLDVVMKGKIFLLPGILTPFIQPVACRYTDWAIPAQFLHPTIPIFSRISTFKRASWIKQCFVLDSWPFHGVT
jgi:hypothetical protein